MKTLRLRDLGLNCDEEIRDETFHEVLEKLREHMRRNHPDEWKRISRDMSEEEILQKVEHIAKDDFRSPI